MGEDFWVVAYDGRLRGTRLEKLTQPASYIVYQEGGVCKVRSGRTGRVEYEDADAASAIQYAVNRSTGGGTVLVKQGVYSISKPILMSPGVTLAGEGPSTVLRWADYTRVGVTIDGATVGFVVGGKADGCTIRDIRVDGNKANQDIDAGTAGLYRGIYFRNSENVRVLNVEVVDTGSTGISFEPGRRILVSGCRVYNAGSTAIHFGNRPGDTMYPEDVIIEGNLVENTGPYYPNGIFVSGIAPARATVVGNVVKGAGDVGIEVQAVGGYGRDVTVVGNTVYDSKYLGIYVDGADGGRFYNVVVSGNAVRKSGLDGIRCETVERCIISGNAVEEVPNTEARPGCGAGIRIRSVKYLIVQGNTVYNTYEKGIVLSMAHASTVSGNYLEKTGGIYVGGDFNNVIGNIIRDNRAVSYSIDVYGSRYCLIAMNTIIDVAGTTQGIREDSTSSSNRIVFNDVRSAISPKISSAGSGTIVKHNAGFTTEASGTATIPAGSTYVDVAHGLSITPEPARIRVVQRDDLGGKSFWVSNVTSTSFRINISSADTVSHSFGWSYE